MPGRAPEPGRESAAVRESVAVRGRVSVPGRAAPAGLLALLALLALLLAGCGLVGSGAGSGSGGVASAAGASCPAPSPTAPGAKESHLQVRSLCALPPQAGQVWHTIDTGGKPAYSRDGIVFNNAERLLPRHDRGYYHEYTVPTPGSKDRGARRLITGQSREVYYSGDHYRSFVVVDATAVGK
ncbi:MAG TPA: ribonuclease domain-containing protein [Pseudonocardia sp.]|jgi:guanyl-specific ribonuclease Sa